MKKIFQLQSIPVNAEIGLLVIRLWVGIGLFAKHGIEKFIHFGQMQQHFPDLLHLGSTTSLLFALLSDGICSVLIIIGLATRLSALIVVINLTIVFLLMHQFSFVKEHAELVYLYLVAMLTILIAGPGKYSIDNRI